MPSGIMKIEYPICWSILFKAVEYCIQADQDGGSSGTSVIIACTLRLITILVCDIQASSNAVQDIEYVVSYYLLL